MFTILSFSIYFQEEQPEEQIKIQRSTSTKLDFKRKKETNATLTFYFSFKKNKVGKPM